MTFRQRLAFKLGSLAGKAETLVARVGFITFLVLVAVASSCATVLLGNAMSRLGRVGVGVYAVASLVFVVWTAARGVVVIETAARKRADELVTLYRRSEYLDGPQQPPCSQDELESFGGHPIIDAEFTEIPLGEPEVCCLREVVVPAEVGGGEYADRGPSQHRGG